MSQFLELLRADKIERVAITDREIRGVAKPDALPTAPGGARDRLRELLGSSSEVRVFTVTRIPGIDDGRLITELEAHRVEFTGKIESTFLRDLFFGWVLPLGVMVAIWMFLRSEEHTSELQSRLHLVCRLLLEKKKRHKYDYLVPTHT